MCPQSVCEAMEIAYEGAEGEERAGDGWWGGSQKTARSQSFEVQQSAECQIMIRNGEMSDAAERRCHLRMRAEPKGERSGGESIDTQARRMVRVSEAPRAWEGKDGGTNYKREARPEVLCPGARSTAYAGTAVDA